MATPGSSRHPDGNRKEHEHSPQIKSNLSGLKHMLHGASYQLKLGIVVSLANVGMLKDPTDEFSFTVMAEGREDSKAKGRERAVEKFDDIVYAFKHGTIGGTLKIQAKHKLGPFSDKSTIHNANTTSATEILVKNKQKISIPKMTLNDFIVDSKNDFCIQQYYKSFLEQPQTMNQNGLEGLIICTNADLNDDAKIIWNEIDTAALGDSTTSLDAYTTSLFDKAGGKCYQLKTNYKRAALARLLINAIKAKEEMVTWQRPLFKEYRAAILGIIDNDRIPGNVPSFKLTDDFLDPTYSNPKPGYEAFRKEFKEQFQREFQINEAAWKFVKKNIQIHVAKNFLSDEKNLDPSSNSFPEDNEEESFKSFCDRFRLVCNTYNQQGLDEAILEIWRNLNSDDNQLAADRWKGFLEEDMVTGKLFKTYFNWLMDPLAKSLDSLEIKKSLENIDGNLAYLKLEPVSEKIRKEVVGSSFRINLDRLKTSDLNRQVETERLLLVQAYDIQFCATLLSDILALQSKNTASTLFLDDSDFINNTRTVENMLRFMEHSIYLIIICHDAFELIQSILRKWETDILKVSINQVFLIRVSSDIPSDLSCFRICDLTGESWEEFGNENITLCGTTISPDNIFQNIFRELPIEQVITLLEKRKQMEENNEILMKYREIESTYVHRPWIDQKIKHNAMNIEWNKKSDLYKCLREPRLEGISIKEITQNFKKALNFHEILVPGKNSGEECDPVIGDEGKKVLILLGEAGYGKSTNLTWLAWHLRKRNPVSLVVRCNLSDYCTDFKPFIQDQSNGTRKLIDETEAIRMLFKLARSSVQLEQEVAQKCWKCLNFSDKELNVSEDFMKCLGPSLNNLIQLLVFKEKFNSGELVLLLDAFDEIAPLYKEVVLRFLSIIAQFKGVRKLYLTSRPYGFKKLFEEAFKDPSFFQLQPLSLQDKGSILYKMMKVKWHKGNIDDEELSDIYKSLCYMLICSLNDMSDVPLNLMMVVDILRDHVYHVENTNTNFSSKSFNTELVWAIFNLSKTSFTVEEFVKVKIRHLLYDKNGGDKNLLDKPHEMERFEKAIGEAKLLHGLVALWLFFDKTELASVLTDTEMSKAKECMDNILEGREKTGIIVGIQNGKPVFIHRTFAEYLAAWWIVKRQIEGTQQDRKKITSQKSFWDEERKELRENIDTILAKSKPLHLAIIERDWATAESLVCNYPNSFYDRDAGERTSIHLLGFYFDFERSWPHFFPKTIDASIINAKEKLFGWTVLDYAFHKDNLVLVIFLLHHGASINIDMLYEQIAKGGKEMVRYALIYSRKVMLYLSRAVIVYESHDARKKMKQFCDKAVSDFFTKKSANFERLFDPGHKQDDECFEKFLIKRIIGDDSVWMLESIIEQVSGKEHFIEMISNKYFELAFENKSTFVLKFFMENTRFTLKNEHIRNCAVYAALKDCKIEFKYFFDHYCFRIKIKDFQPSTIRGDGVYHHNDYLKSDAIDVWDYIANICRTKLEIPSDIMIYEKILPFLGICVLTVRPSILRYLIDSCKLNIRAAHVFSLAIVTNELISKIHREAAIKPSEAYKCLLDVAVNISDVEATNMLRLAITSNLYEFSKCLIERYKIDFQDVDKLTVWNVFHLCASNQRSFWIEEMTSEDTRVSYADGNKTDLFRYMLKEASDMDCFNILDKKGRSILHLAIENEQRNIVEHIVARKLGLDAWNKIGNLSVDAIPNITFCYRTIHAISKSIGEKRWHYLILCVLAKQMAKIPLTNREESQEPNSGRVLLQANAKELYQMAKECSSLLLMYYLHCEFPSAIPTPIYDADWLVCTARTLHSKDYLDVTKWLLNPNEVDENVNLYEVVEKCDAEGYDVSTVNSPNLVKNVETRLSANRSVEEVCKLKLLAVAVCSKHDSMIRNVCETLNVSIDWKVLIEIMKMAHDSSLYKPGTNETDGCAFEKSDFDPIYKYLFGRTSNLGEKDNEGRNVLHLATQSGLGCMVNFLINHNMANVMTTNEKNGWNIFHYFGSRKESWKCCHTENDGLLQCITKRVYEMTYSGIFPVSFTKEMYSNKLKDLCFTHNRGRKSVIHVAVEADNIETATYIIHCRVGIHRYYNRTFKSIDVPSRSRSCYDDLSQIAAQCPFHGCFDYLLHKMAKSTLPANFEHLTEQQNGEDRIIEDACRTAIKYRSVLTLEHLMVAHENQMSQALTGSTSYELVVCMTECIRRNRTSMFKVLLGHYRTLLGIQPGGGVQFEVEKNDNVDDVSIDENKIQWRIINQSKEDVTMNRNYLHLLILSVAYGRLSMIRFLVEMLQLEINKSLVVLIMKGLVKLWDQNCKVASPVLEYLASKTGKQIFVLHLFARFGAYNMLSCLIEEKKLDPNEIDWENGWNAAHYCVSEPSCGTNSENAFKVFKLLMENRCIDCCDLRSRSVLHLAMENGYTQVVEYIINQRMDIECYKKLWYEYDLDKIEKYINKLEQMMQPLPKNLLKVLQEIYKNVVDRKHALTLYYQLYENRP